MFLEVMKMSRSHLISYTLAEPSLKIEWSFSINFQYLLLFYTPQIKLTIPPILVVKWNVHVDVWLLQTLCNKTLCIKINSMHATFSCLNIKICIQCFDIYFQLIGFENTIFMGNEYSFIGFENEKAQYYDLIWISN